MKGVVEEAEACDLILTTGCGSEIRAPCEVMQPDEVPPAVAAQCALASVLLRVLHQAMDELEAEASVVRPAATAYLHFS